MKRNLVVSLAVAASFAAFSGFSQAGPTGARSSPNATSNSAGVEFITGGVGLNARQELLAEAKPYNLHLEFAVAPEGEYLSEVEVNIVDARGNNVLSTRTDGPWLLAQLPAGNYTVSARYRDSVQTQRVSVGTARRHLIVRFPMSAERVASLPPR